MQVKTAKTLVTFPQDQAIIAYNFLNKEAVSCEVEDIYWLSIAPEWVDTESIVENHSQFTPESVREKIQSLVDGGVMLELNTEAAKMEEEYRKSWELGPAAAMFHFTLLDNEFMPLSASTEKQIARAAVDPSPPLFKHITSDAIILPKPSEARASDLLATMQKRRTRREVCNKKITLEELSHGLYAGLGITGFVQTEACLLPLKMTPSGGARNPFEAYVWARNVENLATGIYHYSALEHALEKISETPNELPSSYLAGQDWADAMPAIIFLAADLRRTSWKYSDPNAYRVILIEAGHIAQNIMLSCTSHDLTACPTAALCHSKISNLLQLKEITQTPIYALTIGHPAENHDTYVSVQTIREQLHRNENAQNI
jgi:SagB-type dehydrogenase family enzyme